MALAAVLFLFSGIQQPARAAEVAVWGDNSYGQTNVPSGLSNVVAIAAGYSHSLALVPSPVLVFHSHVVVTVGSDYVLTAPISAGQPAMLQWYHNGALVHSGNTLPLTNLQAADLGQYVARSQFMFGIGLPMRSFITESGWLIDSDDPKDSVFGVKATSKIPLS